MSAKRLIMPNDANDFIVAELKERLVQGITVTIAFGGNSMLPLIDGESDRIELAPLTGEMKRGDVYLFVYQGCCVVHRLLKIDAERLFFRGDNCRRHEVVERKDVLPLIIATAAG